MVLHFQPSFRPHNALEPSHTQDDFFVHATRVAQVQVDYFEWDKGEALLGKTWRLATVAKDYVVDGRRKENALWRTWFQQRLGLKKIDPSVIEWEKLEDVSALCGPVVLSGEMCYSWTASQDAVEVEVRPIRPPMNRSPSSKRGVLRQPQYPFPIMSPESRGGSPETPKFRSLSSGSDSSNPAPRTPPARVAFSGWVARGLILEEPTFYSSPDTTPASEDSSTPSMNPVGWVALDAVVLAQEPKARFRCQQGPPIVWLEPKPSSADDPVEDQAPILKRGRGLQRSRSFFNFRSSSSYKDEDMNMDNVPHLKDPASAATGAPIRVRRSKAKFLIGE